MEWFYLSRINFKKGKEMSFHYVSRAIIIQKNHLLVCHARGDQNCYLPGGHIEIGEKAECALKREIKEEICCEIANLSFFGVIENKWVNDNQEEFELNLIFKVSLVNLSYPDIPTSNEPHLTFSWLNLSKLESSKLEPNPLRIDLKNSYLRMPSYFRSTI